MLRKEVCQINEALAKVLCHNICVLIEQLHESGLKIDLPELAHKVFGLPIKSMKISEKI